MAVSRKDDKGRALRKGESFRPSDGRYVFSYTDAYHIRHFIYSSDLAKLREKEDILKRDQLDGIDSYLAGRITLNEMFDRYISLKTNLRRTTKTNYIYMYNKFVRPKFGTRILGEIRYTDVRAFYKHLIVDGGMQANTASTIHGVLYPTFQMAVRDDIIRKNPTAGVLREIGDEVGKNKGIRHALTVEQQTAFMKFIKGHPVYDHWWTVFTVLLGTGLRCGEFIGLRWQDIDMEKRMINVNHALVRVSVKPGDRARRLGVSLPKTEAGIRTIPMMEQVLEAFKEEYERQSDIGFNKTVMEGMSGFIFQNSYGKVMCEQNINSAISRITEEYNHVENVRAAKEKREPVYLPHFSCHHLRHTFCTRLCENEQNLKVIQSIMGHANIKTTMDIYAEATDSKKQESIDKLSDIWKDF